MAPFRLMVKNTFVDAVSFQRAGSEDEGMRRSHSCPLLGGSRSNSRDDLDSGGSPAVWPLTALGTWADVVSDSEEEEVEDRPSCSSSLGLGTLKYICDLKPAPNATENTPVSRRTPLSGKAAAFVPIAPLKRRASAFVPWSSQVASTPKDEPEYFGDSAADILRQESTKPQTATTVMLRNLPIGFSRRALIRSLNINGFAGLYDFVYIPMDFKTKLCLRYGFVNLTDGKNVQHFINVFDGYMFAGNAASQACKVLLSQTQGLAANIDRYRNSPVMREEVPELFKPALFAGGQQIPFPAPTKELPHIHYRVNR